MEDKMFALSIIGMIICAGLVAGMVFMLQGVHKSDNGPMNSEEFYKDDMMKAIEYKEIIVYPNDPKSIVDKKCDKTTLGIAEFSIIINDDHVNSECTSYMDGFFKGRFYTKEESQNMVLNKEIPLKINISSVLLSQDHIIELCCDDYCKVKVLKNYCEV